MSEITAGSIQFAEKAPTEPRLKLFQRLAKMALEPRRFYLAWLESKQLEDTEERWEAWQSSFDSVHTEHLWGCVQLAAVLDESFRLPHLRAGTEEFQQDVEQKFAALMKRISLLALTLQQEQEKLPPLEATSAELPN